MNKQSALKLVLRSMAVFLLLYFTASHWFFHRFFFHTLGITGPELESPFVASQLQLIGAMVLGFALTLFLIAHEPRAHAGPMKVVLVVGALCSVIFIANVLAGTLPLHFLVNAGVLMAASAMTVALFPWRGQPATP